MRRVLLDIDIHRLNIKYNNFSSVIYNRSVRYHQVLKSSPSILILFKMVTVILNVVAICYGNKFLSNYLVILT